MQHNKKLILLIFFIFSTFMVVFAEDSVASSFNWIAILPFYNLSETKEYQLTSVIVSSIKDYFNTTKNLIIIDPDAIQNIPSISDLIPNGFIWQDTAFEIGTRLKVNLLINGFYDINDDMITLYISLLDIINKKELIHYKETRIIGDQAITVTKNICNELSYKIKQMIDTSTDINNLKSSIQIK